MRLAGELEEDVTPGVSEDGRRMLRADGGKGEEKA